MGYSDFEVQILGRLPELQQQPQTDARLREATTLFNQAAEHIKHQGRSMAFVVAIFQTANLFSMSAGAS